MNKTHFLLIFFIAIFLFPTFTFAQTINQTQVNYVMGEINKKRQEFGYNPLEIDNDLCMLAQKIADDSERNYPEEVSQALNIDSEYKDYLKNYSDYKSSRLTINDILVERVGPNNKAALKFKDDQLASSFTNVDSFGGVAMSPELEAGCIGASSGTIGYKPFAYFVGGVKKEVTNNVNTPTESQNMAPSENGTSQNIFQKFWSSILSLFGK